VKDLVARGRESFSDDDREHRDDAGRAWRGGDWPLPKLKGDGVTLRPLEESDVDLLVAIVRRPGVVEWWGPVDTEERTRQGLRNDGAAFAIEVEGAPAGWLGFDEETDPDHRHAGLDIFLAPEYQGRGLGPAALRLAARWLFSERGHHRLTIDPARENERAIRAYATVGFRPVGVMRRYGRGADGRWHDNLLMDLLAEDSPLAA
jgi:aminoglycoside 6'-N-acetyltransferase